jgi:hypothetical protein
MKRASGIHWRLGRPQNRPEPCGEIRQKREGWKVFDFIKKTTSNGTENM